jgi:DNA-binding GntR family transcriptional regulator
MGGQAMSHHRAMLDAEGAVGPQLYRLIRDRIVFGDLAPGARISETEISALYRVSRQPVREAFIKLAEEGLVAVRPQRGTYVRRISVPGVMAARFVREAVEADIARLASERAGAEDLAALERLIAGQAAEVAAPDPSRFIALDEAFHQRLAVAAGQGATWAILEGLKTPMNRVRNLSARHFPREKLVAQHRAVLAAVAAGDAPAADAAMRTHLREVLNDLPGIVEAMPEFFDTADS